MCDLLSMSLLLVVAGMSLLQVHAAETPTAGPWDSRVTPPFPGFTRAELQWPDLKSHVDGNTFWETMAEGARVEPTIAVDPNNANRMVSLYTDVIANYLPKAKFRALATCARSYSTDGGATWREGQPEERVFGSGQCTNGYVAADRDGNFYSSTMVYNADQTLTDIYLSRAKQDGRLWEHGPLLEFHHDKNTGSENGSIAAIVPEKDYPPGYVTGGPIQLIADRGRTSKYVGRIYYVGEPVKKNESRLFLRYSDDGGRTLSIGTTIDSITMPESDLEGPMRGYGGVLRARLTFDASGRVYAFYILDREHSGGTFDVLMKTSDDGGDTFGPRRLVASNLGPATVFGRIPDPRWEKGVHGIGQWVHLFEVRPAMTPDGKLWLVYADVPFRGDTCHGAAKRFCSGMEVRLVTSTDSGKSWTAPVRVSDSKNEADQFYPEIRAHADGTVSIAWLDKRLHPDNLGYDVYYTNTRDGEHFLPNVRLSSASSILRAGNVREDLDSDINYLGDWQGSDLSGDNFYYIWADLREPKTVSPVKNIYMAGVNLCGAPVPGAPRAVCPAIHAANTN